jgi:hypothetical protein
LGPGSSLDAVINLLGLYLIVIGALSLLQAIDAMAPLTKHPRSTHRPDHRTSR